MMQKHVIMIVADQLRYDVLGKGYTPHIDALAGQSTCFSNAYCASPLCVPARGSLFTGLCPNSTGSLINPWEKEDEAYGYVKEGIDNLYDFMEESGYECIHSGKQHLFTRGGKLEDRPGTKTRWLTTEKTYRSFLDTNGRRMPGGSRFRSPVPEIRERSISFSTTCSNAETGCYEEGESFYFDGYFTSELVKGIQSRDTAKPLFVSAMFLAPHPPFDIPEPWFSKYTADTIELPQNVGTWYPNQSPLQLYNVTGALGSHYSMDAWRESWRVYLGLVSFLDNCVGQVIDELKAQGIYEDCMILFTSDHGEMLGSHRLFQKMCMYEESVKVPLYLHLPGQTTRHLVSDNVSHIDLLPTLCHYLDLHPQQKMEGRSLHPFCEGDDHLPKLPIFIQYDGNSCLSSYQRCVILGKNKLIVDVFKDEVFYEWYDTESDPEETVNLFFESPDWDVIYPVFTLLRQHMIETGDHLSTVKRKRVSSVLVPWTL